MCESYRVEFTRELDLRLACTCIQYELYPHAIRMEILCELNTYRANHMLREFDFELIICVWILLIMPVKTHFQTSACTCMHASLE